jgi:hypothetical protein
LQECDMGVTISLLGLGVLLATAGVWLSIAGHRKLDDALKSLGAAFKVD